MEKENRTTELLFEIGTFRFIDRTWRQFLTKDFANNAEHSFRVAWIALVLAKDERAQVDHGKLLKLALLHDLPESRCGDVHYLSRQYVARNERLALEDMFQATPFYKEAVALWEEYEKKESIESRLVKDADTLDVDMELQEQKASGNTLPNLWSKYRKDIVAKKLFTVSAKKLFKEIVNTNPHQWHTDALRNRFNGGDWKQKNKKPYESF